VELTPELRAIHDLARSAQGEHEVEGLLRRICESVRETFGFERSSISEYRPDHGEIAPLVLLGTDETPETMRIRPLAGLPLLERALTTGETVFVADVRKAAAVPEDLAEAYNLTSIVVVPLITDGSCLGFLAADRGGEPFEPDEASLALLTVIGTLAAVFLEKALAHEALKRVDELKSNFIALASHELRTPAAVIHGISSTLHLRGDLLTHQQLHDLRETLYDQTERMRRLVDQLLDLSRLEANGILIDPQRLHVLSRLQEIALTVVSDRMDQIRFDVAPDLDVVADAQAFERIVSNLVVNAFRYGEAPVEIRAEQVDRHFRLWVEDHGGGVPREFVPRLFDRFSRSARSSDQREGAGLGLAIAQSYAQAHGGELLYEESGSSGASFQLVLPQTDV
jgi:signal transduction histidine kinase